MKTAKHSRRRAQSRGAAMVEAVIVISTFVVFFGFITWERQAYGMKLDLQQTTRANVLYYASHACTGPKNGAGTDIGTAPVSGKADPSGAAKKADIGGSAGAASNDYNNTSAAASSTSSFDAVWDNTPKGSIDLEKHKITRNITAASRTTCNEPKYNTGGASSFTSWMKFGANFIKSGGGIINLVK